MLAEEKGKLMSRIHLIVAMAGATLAVQLRAEPLKTKYPLPKLVGTEVPVKNMKLAPPNDRPWLFDLPTGCTNLALSRPVTASDEPLLGDLELVTDGDKEASDGTDVEIAGGKQWVQIDLGKASEVHAILIWHFHAKVRVYKGVVVQLSDDAKFMQGVTTVFNNDTDNICGQGAGRDLGYIENNYGKLVDAKGTKARYVRFWSNGNTENGMNHYTEIEVWGKN